MKKLTVLITALLLAFSFNAHSQDWVKLMEDRNANVYDVQKAFYQWYGSDEPGKKAEEHESSYDLFKRWEDIMVPRTYPLGDRTTMYSALQNYYSTAHNIKTHAMATGITKWMYAGNTDVPVNGGGDGRINHIRFFPGNTNILYGCAPEGGLWKSTDGGASWTTNTDYQLASIGTTDLAIDPKNPAIMYLGSGDGDGYNIYTLGIYKSTDTGKTWNLTSLNCTFQFSGQYGLEANQLLINPDSTNVVFAGMDYGLYRSRDYGNTWTQILNQDVQNIQFEPFHTNIVYASTEWDAFYRSTDGGQTFTQITNGVPVNSDIARISIGVSPADSNRVYLLVDENAHGRFYGLYMSTDRGQTFTTQSSFAGGAPNLLGYSPTGNDSIGQGWYTLPIAVSPTNADTVLIGGVNIWMSGNKGVTWALNAEWTGNGAPYVHADVHHILFYPGSGSRYIAACDGGVFTTGNKGATWTNISNNLEIGQLYTVGLSALTPGLTISGWQDNGTNISGIPWVNVTGGDGETAFIDYTNDSNLFSSYQNGTLLYSTDAGSQWYYAADSIITESGAWTTPWLQDPYQPHHDLVFAGFENLWYSKAPTFNWAKLSTWGKQGEHLNAIAVYPKDDDYIYVSRGDSLFATKNFGYSWTVINDTLPLNNYQATDIIVDPANPDKIWVTFSGYGAACKVYQSYNGGLTWKNISTGLPNLPINCIIRQPNSPNGLYVGTDIGVYYHDTILNTWISFNNGLPNVMVRNLEIDELMDTLVAATFGRGLWKTGTYITTSVNNITDIEMDATVYPNPTNGNVTLVMNGAAPGDYTITALNLLGQVVYSEKVNITGNFTKNLNFSEYGKGVYLLRIEGNNSQTVKKIVEL